MKAKGDWYFDGYEARQQIGTDGRPHRELVYTGEYYGFSRGQDPRPIKAICTAATAVFLLFYILAALSSAPSARVPYIGMPLMLSMAPGAYLILGLVCFWRAEREMTARVCFSSLRRMDRALRVMLFLAVFCLAGCAVRVVQVPACLREAPDRRYLICAVLSCASILFEFFFLRRNPVIIVRDPDPQSARSKELEEKKAGKRGKSPESGEKTG